MCVQLLSQIFMALLKLVVRLSDSGTCSESGYFVVINIGARMRVTGEGSKAKCREWNLIMSQGK